MNNNNNNNNNTGSSDDDSYATFKTQKGYIVLKGENKTADGEKEICAKNSSINSVQEKYPV